MFQADRLANPEGGAPAPNPRTWVALAVLGVALGVVPARAIPGDSPQPVRRYAVRAEIVRLPAAPNELLRVRHEAVDDFVDVTGARVGMSAMTMEFPVGEGESLDGLQVGDKIEAMLVVDWSRGWGALEHIKRLPPETVLHFRKARPPRSPAARSAPGT